MKDTDYNQLKNINVPVHQVFLHLFLKGKVAFTPQEPWVINDTIKMNILFGKIFHKRHFQQILKYCCLEDIKEETIVNGKVSHSYRW